MMNYIGLVYNRPAKYIGRSNSEVQKNALRLGHDLTTAPFVVSFHYCESRHEILRSSFYGMICSVSTATTDKEAENIHHYVQKRRSTTPKSAYFLLEYSTSVPVCENDTMYLPAWSHRLRYELLPMKMI